VPVVRLPDYGRSLRVMDYGQSLPERGDGHSGKKEKNKNYSWYSVQGPGRMAQTPQAGTCDSVSRFRRYHCSTVINYESYFLMGDQFCFLFLTVMYDLDSRITAEYSKCQTFFYSMQVSFRFHPLRCSEILVSPSICTKIRTWRFHRTEEVSNNFSVS